ncbi:MAG: hypothetical protein M3228_02080 [Actinomycetota bacterium]|nr:hypothetical protein [Actinomycetota bacterium]
MSSYQNLLCQGASELTRGPLDADQVLTWLGKLVKRTCDAPRCQSAAAIGNTASLACCGVEELGVN